MVTPVIKLKVQLTIQGNDEIRDLNGIEFVFGRSTGSSVHINDPAFSRSHFKIFSKNHELWITDLNSSNGTFVNKLEISPDNPVKLLEEDLISVHNSATMILIKKFEIEGKPKQSVVDSNVETSMDISDFSQQIIAVANEKVEQLIVEANVRASKIIEEALSQIKKDEEASILKCKNEISEMRLASENDIVEMRKASEYEIAEFLKLGRENSLLEIEKYKNEKLEQVNQRIVEENTKLAVNLESAKQKQAEQIKQMEAILSQRGNDLNELEKTFKSNFEKQNIEIESKLAVKKKELIAVEIEFEQMKTKQAAMLEAHLESKRIEGEKKLIEIESKTKKTKDEFENLYTQYEQQKNSQIEELNQIALSKKLIADELAELEKIIVEKKQIFDNVSKEHDLAQQNFQELSNKLQDSSKEHLEITALIENSKNNLEKIQNDQQAITNIVKELHDKKSIVTNELSMLEKESSDLKNKIVHSSQESSRFLAEQEKEIANIKNKFIQEKAALDSEMRKLKESEEKKLQELVTLELSKINKLKEDSLKLILDLEDSITKELSHSTSKVFANTVGIAKFKEIAPDYEKSIRDSLKSGVLKLLKNELTASDSSKAKKLSTNKSLKPMFIGASISAIVFGVIPFSIKYVQEQNDPIKQQLEMQARRAAIPVKKFIPVKVDSISTSIVSNVIYTNNYYETVSTEKYRSELMKQGSVYLYKQWQMEEEKSIQAFAMIFSLVDAVHGRIDKIDPDNEKKDIEKLDKLEKETMKKLEGILGNEVRLEAALKFQARFYKEYTGQKN